MVSVFLQSIVASLIVSAVSLTGIAALFFGSKRIDDRLLYLLSLSAGGMLGGALFHLLPEALAMEGGIMTILVTVAIGFAVFFVLERFVHLHHHHWHHHDEGKAGQIKIGYINLVGDALHNFIDGIAIVASFAVGVPLGIAVTIAIIFHEIPQEIGDFGVLLYAGFSKSRALFYNFLVALLAVAGVIAGFFLLKADINAERFLLPLAAGAFIYIAGANLIPEMHKEEEFMPSIFSFVIFIFALILMFVLKFYFE